MKHPSVVPSFRFARRLLLLAALLFLAAVRPLSAANVTWNGGAVPDGNWLTPGNWGGTAPSTNDLLFFTGATQTSTTNNFPSGTPFNNINFNSGAAAFTLRGNPIVLASPFDIGSGLISGGSITNVTT